jgi:hypothetical protein
MKCYSFCFKIITELKGGGKEMMKDKKNKYVKKDRCDMDRRMMELFIMGACHTTKLFPFIYPCMNTHISVHTFQTQLSVLSSSHLDSSHYPWSSYCPFMFQNLPFSFVMPLK